jgi:hypothetical protein
MTPIPHCGHYREQISAADCYRPGILEHTKLGKEAHQPTSSPGEQTEGLIMSTPNPFSEQFLRLLGAMPDKYSLEEWQYLYREVIFSMGMQILERFSKDVLGPDPFVSRRGPFPSPPPPGHGPGYQPPPGPQPGVAGHGPGYQPGGHGPGYQPSVVIAVTALGLGPVHGKDP